MRKHLIYASAANTWGFCAPSVALSATVKRPKTQAQREGDASHWVGAQMLKACLPGATSFLFEEADFLNKSDPAGTVLTPDIIRHGSEYAFRVIEVANATCGMQGLHVEEAIPVHYLAPDLPDVIPDAWFYDESTRVIYVFDAKFGHRYVAAEWNLQFVVYAQAIMQKLGIHGGMDESVVFQFEIVQPTCFYKGQGEQTWTVLGSELRAITNVLRHQIDLVERENGETRTGPHCLGCSATHICPASRRAGGTILDYLMGHAIPEPLPDDALGYEKTIMEHAQTLIKSRLTALDAEVEARIMGGKLIPGWRVENATGNRTWSVDASDVKALGEAYGVVLTDEKPVTPAEAERRNKKAGGVIDEDVIKAYTHRPSAGTRVVPDDISRAEKTFK